MHRSRYTIVVSSCDAYSDLWEPFFKVLKDEWEGLERIPIVLNTESRSFSYEGLDITTMQLYRNGQQASWTERLRRTLERIDTEYILFLLDDFFMQATVKADLIDRHVKWLDSDRSVSMLCYKETFASKNIKDGKYEGFERRPLFGAYKFNCQAALWRRKRLISYLKVDENPWEWETFGNWRSFRHPFHRFYSALPGNEHVFPYIYDLNGKPFGGIGIYRGKWFLPYIEPIFKKHDIEMDYSVRGTLTDDDFPAPSAVPEKRKENAPRWKQCVWFIRPIYIRIKECYFETVFFLRHLRHFL